MAKIKPRAPTFKEVIKLKRIFSSNLSIIPLLRRTKRPATKWKRVVNGEPFTEEELREIWDEFQGKLNPGIATGRFSSVGLVVLDLDGRQAVEVAKSTFPATPMITISREGESEHHYYRIRGGRVGEPVRNRQDIFGSKARFAWEAKEKLGLDVVAHLARDMSPEQVAAEEARVATARAEALQQLETGPIIDVRGDGGQVVAPGALHPKGHIYRMAEGWTDAMLADVPYFDPAWLEGKKWRRPGTGGPISVAKLKAKRGEREVEEARASTSGDEKLKRASAYLATIEGAESGHAGHNKTFYAANCLVSGFDLDGDEAFALLRDEYNPRCEPLWSLEELAHKINDAVALKGPDAGYLLVERPEFRGARKVIEHAEYVPDGSDFELDEFFAEAALGGCDSGTAAADHHPGTDGRDGADSGGDEAGWDGSGSSGGDPGGNGPGGGGGNSGGGPGGSSDAGGNPPPPSKDEHQWRLLWRGRGVDLDRQLTGKWNRWIKKKVNGAWTLPLSTNNLLTFLLHSKFFSFDLSYNLLKRRIELDGQPLTDAHEIEIAGIIELAWQAQPDRNRVRDAIVAAANANPYDPVLDYFDSLPTWDGESRLDRVPAEILSTPSSMPVYGAMFRNFVVGLVVRQLRPGEKMDNMLVLVGLQGDLKSSFFRLLVDGHRTSGEWFTDEGVPLGDKDGLMLATAHVLIEWSEATHLKNRRAVDNVKQFLAKQVDVFRKPYGRNMEAYPRRCVFCGSSNDAEILHDPSGSRRFYVIPVGDRIDLAKLEAWRDQLFAEALTIAKAWLSAAPGSDEWMANKFWFDSSEDGARRQAVSVFEAEGLYDEKVEPFLAERTEAWVVSGFKDVEDPKAVKVLEEIAFTRDDICDEALKMQAKDLDGRAANEIIDALRRLGCTKVAGGAKKRLGGRRARFWLPSRPAFFPEDVRCFVKTKEEQLRQLLSAVPPGTMPPPSAFDHGAFTITELAKAVDAVPETAEEGLVALLTELDCARRDGGAKEDTWLPPHDDSLPF